MKVAGGIALALVLAAGWWLWQRVGADVLLNAMMGFCG